MNNRPSILQLIDNLPFVKTVDTMLLEGTPAIEVAKFIQIEMTALVDLNRKSLTNELLKRRDRLRGEGVAERDEQTKRWFDANPTGDGDDEDLDDEALDGEVVPLDPDGVPLSYVPSPFTPSAYRKKIYERAAGNMDELVEMEALYRSQLSRIDRLVSMEHEKKGYIESLGRDFKIAIEALARRVEIKKALGLIDGDTKFREQLDLKGYSKETATVLSNPEARHRVVDLVERIRKNAKKKLEQQTG